ncbi:MAG: hypothetical protein LAT67_02340 [Balneolales bacterium]|nr:hypothetical protein [Balneolales bacterium]
MKAAFVIIFLGSWGLQLIFPWWTIIIPCFIAGLIGPDRGYKAFTAGMLGVGALWLMLALIADFRNDGIMAAQVADIMTVPVWALYVITWAIGSITGGFACLSGYLVLGRVR